MQQATGRILVVLALLLAGPAAARTVAVDGPEALARALAAARGGETLLLAPGDYGPLALARAFAPPVTVASDPATPARFARIEITGRAGGLRFEGLEISGEFRVTDGPVGVALVNSRVGTGGHDDTSVYTRAMADLVLEDNDIRAGHHGLILNDIDRARIRGNVIHHAKEDLVRVTGRSRRLLIENNTLWDTAAVRPLHPDLLTLFGHEGRTPHDIVIRGNYLYDDMTTGDVFGQGIFIAGPGPDGFRDILVEQNLICVDSPISLVIEGGVANVVIRDNTLMPSVRGGGGIIQTLARNNQSNAGIIILGNVAKRIVDETRSAIIGDNHVYGRDAPLARLFSGPCDRWQGFMPLPTAPFRLGSPWGAQDRLQALMSGDR